jgi:hypothetical protein
MDTFGSLNKFSNQVLACFFLSELFRGAKQQILNTRKFRLSAELMGLVALWC